MGRRAVDSKGGPQSVKSKVSGSYCILWELIPWPDPFHTKVISVCVPCDLNTLVTAVVLWAGFFFFNLLGKFSGGLQDGGPV